MSTAPVVLTHGSPEWIQARLGHVTASRCFEVVNTLIDKKKEPAARKNYRAELISEILTREPAYRYITPPMRWGTEQEQYARAAYEVAQDVTVREGGFIMHPRVPRFGASPDGLVGSDGMVQIKCPETATHLETIRSGSIPLEHGPQLLAELACTGRRWVDFVSFDPRLPEHLQLYIRRFHRDDALIVGVEAEVVRFNTEIDVRLAELKCADLIEVAQPKAMPAAPPAQPQGIRKPQIDDVDGKGKVRYADYAAFVEAKDAWLLEEAVRRCLELITYQPNPERKPQ